MNLASIFSFLGMVGGIVMPLFNVFLILRIVQRKSSSDISLIWTFGIWLCVFLMLPQALVTADPVLKGFGICNFILFSTAACVILKYR